MAWWQWSRTAAANATADASINWSEGQSPSSVNDSARALMARAAEFRDDTSGLLVTSGSSTAYTVSTNQGLQTPTPVDGQLLAVTFHALNAASATLQADGGTAYPIWASVNTPVPSGTLLAGSVYSLRFNATNSAWLLRDFYNSPFIVPVGGFVPYLGTAVPNNNFALPEGQAISRTTYATLFSLIGTTYGVGDGVTTFNIPDIRGRVFAHQDAGTGRLGIGFGATGGEPATSLSLANLPPITPTGAITNGAISAFTTGAVTLGLNNVAGVNLANGGGLFQTGPITIGVSQATSSFTGNSFGGNVPHNTVQSTFAGNYILRIQ